MFVGVGEKRNIVVVCGENAVKNKADASKIIKRLADIAGTKGGGKKDFATCGALTNCEDIVLQEEFFRIIEEVDE